MLLTLYLGLLQETLSPDVVALGMMRARDMSRGLGISDEEFEAVARRVAAYWQANRSPLSRMF